ncbi:MAG: DUF3307 domain-containing protein [Flavobacterium sp.]|nr:DUF3307 domain-containing protein [Flavobacterium sp.]MDD5151232.1 DUF3307 domain-containing protein [Flavobacterium sp.]
MTKHFFCDFPFQIPYMYKNKGKYLHLGGILHSLTHGIFTGVILSILHPTYIWLAIIDFILHYHIDWAKVKINTYFNLQPNNSEWYWVLLGFDQLCHFYTYFGIAYICWNL